MNKLHIKIIAVAALAACAGCQTRITAEKYAEKVTPIQKVVKVNGEDVVITSSALISSGGWYASARSPLWATEALSGLDLGVATNGTVYLRLNEYNRDLSTNAVAITKVLCDSATDITAKICAAIVSHGGSVVTSKVSSLVSKFISSGGDPAKATVSCDGGNCTITDGTITCDGGKCWE